jgi:hypothetical protein
MHTAMLGYDAASVQRDSRSSSQVWCLHATCSQSSRKLAGAGRTAVLQAADALEQGAIEAVLGSEAYTPVATVATSAPCASDSYHAMYWNGTVT